MTNKTNERFRAFAAGVFATLAGILSMCAAADTVAWWHFDESEAGTAAAANTITNETAPGVYARACSFEGATATENAGDHLPTYTRPFAGLEIFDPVSGACRTNRSAMSFTTASRGTDNSGRAYYGGALAVPGADTLYSPLYGTEEMTVECFVCTTGTVCHSFAPIVAAVASPDNLSTASGNFLEERYAILMFRNYDDASIAVRFTTSSGNSIFYNSEGGYTKRIDDGFWHHVAFTYDGSNVRIYVDYVLQQTAAKSGSINSYVSGTKTWIGGYGAHDGGGNGYRRFNGLVDEVRVSSAVLTPEQFLRMRPVRSGDGRDPDEVLHISFDGAAGKFFPLESVSDDFALQGFYCQAHATNEGRHDTADKAGAMMFDGVFSDRGAEDAASFYGNSNFVKVPKLSNALGLDELGVGQANLSVTVEAFFKLDANASDATLFKLGTASASNIVAQCYIGSDNKLRLPYFTTNFNAGADYGHDNSSGWERLPGDSAFGRISIPTLGEWHHIAFVRDASTDGVRVYYDYRCVDEVKNRQLVPVMKDLALFIGSNENGAQLFPGRIDDVRVTKRALRMDEFLTTHAVGSASPKPLLLANFENDYEVQSLAEPGLSDFGTGEARTGGTVPEFVKTTPWVLLLDGTNGTKRAKNFYSAYVDGSRIRLPVSRLYMNDAYTVELWAKFTGYREGYAGDSTSLPHNAELLRLVQSGDPSAYNWLIYRPNDDAYVLKIAARNASNKQVEYWGGIPMPKPLADGSWHHYAFTFEPVDDEGVEKTDFSLYYDYELLGTLRIPFRIYVHSDGQSLVLCNSSYDEPNLKGYINALRYSRGVLTPDKFLGLAPGEGLVVVLQ